MPALIGGGDKERLIGLDLARALAILSVVIGHSGWPLPLGVDLFFALSGFLIGSLLLDIIDRDPSLRSWFIFLVRRWMRTLPLYVLWVVVLFMLVPPTHDLGLHALKYLTFTQNFAWPMPRLNWFGVSWSLAVEEWFYLLFSAILIALAAWTRRWAVLIACGVFIAVPLFLRTAIGAIDGTWDAQFRKIVVFRLDAIAYGVLIAWLYRYWQVAMHLLAYPLLVLGVVCVILPKLNLESVASIRPHLTIPLVPLGFSLMMPWAMQVHIGLSSLTAAIHWLSTRSYCIYITHFSLLKISWLWLGKVNSATLIALLVSATLAELSYRYFEMPLLKRRPPQFRQQADAVPPVRDMEAGRALPAPTQV